MRRRRPPISSLLATGRPASRRQGPQPHAGHRAPGLLFRAHDVRELESSPAAGHRSCASASNEAGALAGQIADVQRAAGQLRMAEAVLDQVALYLVEMESYFVPAAAIDQAWSRRGIASSIERIHELFDVARVQGRKLFGGVGAIEAGTADAAAALELPALDVDSLGDPRVGMIATLVELPVQGGAIIAAAQVQVAIQKSRVCECAAKIGDMIQALEIALEMHAAAGASLSDDTFTQAVAKTTQVDVFLATRNTQPVAEPAPTFLRIQRQPR